MRHWTIVGLLTLMWAVVVSILLTPEIPNGHGFEHPRFQAMDQGGDGAERHDSIFVAGWMFGSVLIALFVALLAWGTVVPPGQEDAPQPNQVKPDLRLAALILGGLLYEGVFAAVCLAYRDSLTAAKVTFLGPFPAGVSWILFGVWLIPGIFVVFYVVFFYRWILPPQSLQNFAAIVHRVVDDSRPTGEMLASDRKD